MNPTIKHRNMLVQVFLFIITCGIYGLYWFYQTTVEMKELDNEPDISPGLLTVLLLLPPLNIYSFYKHSQLFEDIADDGLSKWILFILWFVFMPAVWFIVQIELNKKAVALNPALA
jgi:hypothetical protein